MLVNGRETIRVLVGGRLAKAPASCAPASAPLSGDYYDDVWLLADDTYSGGQIYDLGDELHDALARYGEVEILTKQARLRQEAAQQGIGSGRRLRLSHLATKPATSKS